MTLANEDVQQLALTGTDQLRWPTPGSPDGNSSQFFITTGSPNAELGYNYTSIRSVGQRPGDPGTDNSDSRDHEFDHREKSEPANPLTITSTTLSRHNPNGVAIIDTTQAKPGESSTITVAAIGPADRRPSSPSSSRSGPMGDRLLLHSSEMSISSHMPIPRRQADREHRTADPVGRPEHVSGHRYLGASDLFTCIEP